MVTRKAPQGRPRSVPQSLFDTVFSLHSEGKGYQRISNSLNALGHGTSKSSVARLLKGLAPYQDAREKKTNTKQGVRQVWSSTWSGYLCE